MDLLWKLLDAVLPLLKNSPLYLISIFVMTVEGVGIQVQVELFLLPDHLLKKLKDLPGRTGMMLFFGLAWTALWLGVLHLARVGFRPITPADLESTMISGLLVSTASAFLMFLLTTLVFRER